MIQQVQENLYNNAIKFHAELLPDSLHILLAWPLCAILKGKLAFILGRI